jgi:hypothetical protein
LGNVYAVARVLDVPGKRVQRCRRNRRLVDFPDFGLWGADASDCAGAVLGEDCRRRHLDLDFQPEQDMREEDDYEYYQAMFRDSIIWSVAIVVSFALFALLA